MRALFFGDSLVAGKGDPEGLGWVGRLDGDRPSGGPAVTAVNFGVPGETSTQILSRWQGQADREIEAGTETVVVFSFGANDTTEEFGGGLRIEAADSVRNLVDALTGAAARDLPAFVVGPAPVNDDAQHRRIERRSDEFAVVCERAGVPFVAVARDLIDQGDWVREARAGDGAHPAAMGYTQMARLIRPHWESWIAAPDHEPPHVP